MERNDKQENSRKKSVSGGVNLDNYRTGPHLTQYIGPLRTQHRTSSRHVEDRQALIALNYRVNCRRSALSRQ